MFHADVERTSRRRAQLQSYIEEHLLDSASTFCCEHYTTSCRPSVGGALSFTEGEMPHVGLHYDLSDDDGREYRVVVVGQERGRGVARATMDDWWKRIMKCARREVAPDPTLKGMTYALMELYGLSPNSWGSFERESIHADGMPVHVLDCFALTNSTLCSAASPGQPSKGRATPQMRANCASHLSAMLNILQPTFLVLLGKSAREAAGLALNTRVVQDHPFEMLIGGSECKVFPFAHPVNRETPWRSERSLYLRDTVLPALLGNAVGERRGVPSALPAVASRIPSQARRSPDPPAPSQRSILAFDAASSTMIQPNANKHVMLVGCIQEIETQRVLDGLSKKGVAASPWSFRLKDEYQRALSDCPYLYVYRPATSWLRPNQAIVECLWVEEWQTSRVGIPCPWNDLNEPYDQATELLDGKPIRTWFRIADRRVLTRPIHAYECRRARDGAGVSGSHLLGGFGLWTVGPASPISLPCLADRA